MIYLIYGAVIFVATCLGAFVGLGGGVIIKPVMDFIGFHSLQEIAFYSSAGVFVMALTSTAKHIRKKTPIDIKTVLLFSLGSVFGGFLGNRGFDYALKSVEFPDTVKCIQSLMLFILMVFVIISVNAKIKGLGISNPAVITISGLILGFIAAFLGIGGGPVNVAVLTVLFSFTMKDAAVYSVAVIVFSQFVNLVTMYIETGFKDFDFKILAVVAVCAVFGGTVGAGFNRKYSEKTIRTVFTVVVLGVALLTLYNFIRAVF